MISFPIFALFVVGALALVASPGPDFFYVLSRGMAQGRRAGLLSALGISLGLLVHTALATLGLTALLQTSAVAFGVVKTVGALYLIWIGVRMCRSQTLLHPEIAPIEYSKVVRQGVLTNVFNPKVALTFLAFLPQFVKAGHGAQSFQVAVFGTTLMLIALCWFSLIGYFAGSLGAWFGKHARFSAWIQKAMGTVLISLGVRLALTKR